MTDKIPSLKERLSKYTIKPSDVNYPGLVMLYGRPGSGKTWLAASVSELPSVNKVLYIDTEGSTEGTLVGFNDDKIDILNIPKTVRNINDSADGSQVTEIQFLDSVLDELLATNTSGYDAIVIDTLDVAQDWKVKELTPIWEKKNKFKIWDLVSDWTENIGQRLKSLDAVGVIVLHSKKDKDESSDEGSSGKGKQVIIHKLLVPVDLKKIKDLQQLLALLQEVEDYAAANEDGEPGDDEDAAPAPA